MMVVIDRFAPNWQNLRIHESSPGGGGLSKLLKTKCRNYVPTQYFSDVAGGTYQNGVRSENLEKQSFPDAAFDLVVTQDVMEHVFNPDLAYSEIARTLSAGGLHIHTTPIYKGSSESIRCASLVDGEVVHLRDPEYHGNPIGDGRSLVTFRYGEDLASLIRFWTSFDVEILSMNDPTQGLVGEFLDVIVCRKPS